MQSSSGKLIAQIGGAALAVSVLLPWFQLEASSLLSIDFSLRELEQGSAIALAVVGGISVLQPRIASVDVSAMVYLVVGLLALGAIIYRVYIDEPGLSTLGGTEIDSVSIKDLLKSIGIDLRPDYGAHLGIAGAALVTFGALAQVRVGGSKQRQPAIQAPPPPVPTHKPSRPDELAADQQRYVAPRRDSSQS